MKREPSEWGDRRDDISDRPVLRFALSARPTASQGEAPARAIGNMEFQEETKDRVKTPPIRSIDSSYRRGIIPQVETTFTQNT